MIFTDEIRKALDLVMQAFRKEHGEGATLEEGEEFVTIFHNCILILSLNNGELGVRFVGGKPVYVNEALGFYGEAE